MAFLATSQRDFPVLHYSGHGFFKHGPARPAFVFFVRFEAFGMGGYVHAVAFRAEFAYPLFQFHDFFLSGTSDMIFFSGILYALLSELFIYSIFPRRLFSMNTTSPSCISPDLSLNFTASPIEYFMLKLLFCALHQILLYHEINQILDPSCHYSPCSGIIQKVFLDPA